MQLLKAQVDVVFMTRGGRVNGRLVANESKFAELRLRQLQTMNNPDATLALAKGIVFGKLSNQLAMLQRAVTRASSQPAPAQEDAPQTLSLVPKGKPPITGGKRAEQIVDARAYGTAVRGIREMLAQSVNAGNPDSLRGYEGKAGAWYWPAFKLFLADDMGFNQRIYNPPGDPVNALLSFGYALLQKDVAAAVQIVGLDPYLGFFHTVQYGRPSLVLDLMEEFRPVLVDPLVVRLVNLGMIKPRDFKRGTGDERPFSMTDEAVRVVIEAYETRVTSNTRYSPTGDEVTFRRCIELQTRHFARVIKGEELTYKPFVLSQ
jgi:CRISPR-associated protein Cas1